MSDTQSGSGIRPQRVPTTTPGAGVGLQLLRAILENAARTEFRALQDDLFNVDELPYFRYIGDYYRRHGILPTLEVMAEANLALRHAATGTVGHYYERVFQRAQYNVYMAEQPQIVQALGRRDIAGANEILQRLSAGVSRFVTEQDTFTMAESVEQVLTEYEHASANPGIQGITTGWAYLDEITGGVEPGDVMTYVARPGMGKTWLMTHAAQVAWRAGASVLFVTNEMTHVQIARRFLGLQAGVNPDYIRRGQLSTFARDVVYATARNVGNGAPFHLISGSFNKSVPAVDAAIAEFAPDVVYIDASYLMKAQGNNSRKAKHEVLSDVGEEVKQMALRRHRPVIQSVQFNRGHEKEKGAPSLANIAGTDAVGQISTIVVAVGEGPQNSEHTARTLDLMKNREGTAVCKMVCNFLFNPPNFDYVPTDEEGRALLEDPTADEWAVV